MITKACSLTKDEVLDLIYSHSSSLGANDVSVSLEDRIERINYLHKRLKTFDEIEMKPEPTPAPVEAQKGSW